MGQKCVEDLKVGSSEIIAEAEKREAMVWFYTSAVFIFGSLTIAKTNVLKKIVLSFN